MVISLPYAINTFWKIDVKIAGMDTHVFIRESNGRMKELDY